MIKINLLPKTINEKAAIRNLAVLLGVVLVAVIVGGFVFTQNLKTQVADMEAKATQAEAAKAEVEKISSEAGTIRSSIAPIKSKVDFIQAVMKYNTEYPALYEQVAKWTYSKVSLLGITCDGTKMQLTGKCKTLDDLGRYLLNMYRATDLFTSVVLSSTLPGYPKTGGQGMGAMAPGGYGGYGGYGGGYGPQASMAGMGAISTSVNKSPTSDWIAFTVDCTLKKPIVAPTYTAGAAGAGGAAGAAGAAAAPAAGAAAPAAPAGPPM